MTKALKAYIDGMDYACGVNNINSYKLITINQKPKKNAWGGYHYQPKPLDPRDPDFQEGCGITFSNHINNKECKAAYDFMAEHFTLMYQSPLRGNKIHHGRKSFCCIWDTSKCPPLPEGAVEAEEEKEYF